MPNIGRPPTISQAKIDEILQVVAAGNFLDVAAWFCGVHRVTVWKWWRKGKRLAAQERHGIGLEPEDALYATFYNRVERAKAEAHVRHVVNINAVARGIPARRTETTRTLPDGTVERVIETTEGQDPVWTASAWFLERTDFKRWGKKERREVTGADGAPVLPLAAVRDILREDAPAE